MADEKLHFVVPSKEVLKTSEILMYEVGRLDYYLSEDGQKFLSERPNAIQDVLWRVRCELLKANANLPEVTTHDYVFR